MNIGLALAVLIAMVLYLIDRNQKWPQAWKYAKRTVAVLIALGVLGWSGTYLYSEWQDYQYKQAAIESERQAKKAVASRWAELEGLQGIVCGEGKVITVKNDGWIGEFPEKGEVNCTDAVHAGEKTLLPDTLATPPSTVGCVVLQTKIPSFTCGKAAIPVVPIRIPSTPSPVSTPKALFGNARVIKDTANLCEPDRDHPDSGFGYPFLVITTVSFPARIKVLSRNQEWSRVQLQDGRIGYLGTSELQMDAPAPMSGTEKAEHKNKTSHIRLTEIWLHDAYGNHDWLSDIRIQNDTNETIQSLTLALSQGYERARYVKFLIRIEPNESSLFSNGSGIEGVSSAYNGCPILSNTDQSGAFLCDLILGVPHSKGLMKIEVADFEKAQ